MTGQSGKPHAMQRVVGFYDISRARFHSPVRRHIYIKVPPEDKDCPSGIGRLLKAMYGTRDAAQCFDSLAENVMQKLGFRVGLITPCVYFCAERNAECVRHGDDFILLADRATRQ